MIDSPPSEPTTPRHSSRHVVRGVSWALLMRWSIRLVGFVSTVILARLLSPEDFGIAAMGMLVIAFLFQFSEFGTSMYLIRSKEIDRAHCDAAWTMTLLQGLVIAVLLLLLAEPAGGFFKEPQVVQVVQVLALAAFIGGFENIGPVLARRDLKFDVDFRFNVYRKLLVFGTTLGCAVVLRSYWALVVGYVTGTTASVVLSYLMFPYRPRFSLARAPEYLRFSVAVLPMRIGKFLNGRSAVFVVGGMGHTPSMGLFTVSASLATMFTRELVTPMGRGLFPNYTRLAHDPPRLAKVYRQVLGLLALACVPLGVGLSAVAEDAVAVILGAKWSAAVPIIEWLAISGILAAMTQALTAQILIATHHERDAAILPWLRLGITLPILLIGADHAGLLGIAQASVVAQIACLPVTYLTTRRAVALPSGAVAGLIWRPVVAALVMYLAVTTLHPSDLGIALVRLFIDVTVGALTYGATLLLLWAASGRPDGPEQILLRMLTTRLGISWRPLAG